MKKQLLMLLLGGWALGAAAQTEVLTLTKVKTGEEPQAVLNAINRDYPNLVSKDLSFLPKKIYGQEWNILSLGDSGIELISCDVTVREGNLTYTAVYDKDGKLLSSKETIDNAHLPTAVVSTINKFSGWKVDGAKELIKCNGRAATTQYKVRIQKGIEHKNVFVNPKGDILKEMITL